MQKSGYLIIGCAAISIAALWFSVGSFHAPLEKMGSLRGVVTSKRCVEGRHGNIATVEFEVAGSTDVYRYPDVLPHIRDFCETMKIGTNVVLLYSTAGAPEIWGATIEGESFIDIQEAKASRRTNGWWGLALGLLFLTSGLAVWKRHGFNSHL